jgi:hypothetical protein
MKLLDFLLCVEAGRLALRLKLLPLLERLELLLLLQRLLLELLRLEGLQLMQLE